MTQGNKYMKSVPSTVIARSPRAETGRESKSQSKNEGARRAREARE